MESPSSHTHTQTHRHPRLSVVVGTVDTRRYRHSSAGALANARLVPTNCKMSGAMGWRRASVVLAAVVVMVAVTAGGVDGRPDGTADDRNKNPVFNIWEFAISNSRYNPTRRDAPTPETPCEIAIVNCCLITHIGRREDCFTRENCSGAWFNDLCSKEFTSRVHDDVHDAFSKNGF